MNKFSVTAIDTVSKRLYRRWVEKFWQESAVCKIGTYVNQNILSSIRDICYSRSLLLKIGLVDS